MVPFQLVVCVRLLETIHEKSDRKCEKIGLQSGTILVSLKFAPNKLTIDAHFKVDIDIIDAF